MAPRRFYSIRPAWHRRYRVPIEIDEGENLILTTSKSFEVMEARYREKIPSSGRLLSKPRKMVPDLILTGGDAPIVTATFKSVVETMAPREAEFRPFALRWADNSPVPGQRHLCNFLKRIDCFDFERMGKKRPQRERVQAAMRADPMTEEEYYLREGYWNEAFGDMYVDPATIEGVHIWRPRWRPRFIFVTDEMLEALKRSGVANLEAERLGTPDEPLRPIPPL